MSLQKVSEYVNDFIAKHGDNNLKSKWNENEFKKLFNKKEKNTTKKNKSAYMFFCDEERENIKKEGLTLSNKEIVSELGARWTNFKTKNPAGVEKFQKLADEDKVRYANEIETEDENVKSSKKKKNVSSVKKNKSAYMFFCIEDREKIKKEGLTLSNKEIITEMAKRWKKLNESNSKELQRFQKLAEDDKNRYSNEKNKPSSDVVVEEEIVVEEPPAPVPAPVPVKEEKVKKPKKAKK